MRERRSRSIVSGGYHLSNDHQESKRDRSSLTLLRSFSPDEVVQRMKRIIQDEETSTVETDDHDFPVEGEESSANSSALDSSVDNVERSIGSSDRSFSPSRPGSYNYRTHAKLLDEQDLVHFDPKAKVYTVRSLDQQVVHAVHFDKSKDRFRCSCPSLNQSCVHVVAVRLYIGKYPFVR